MTLLPNRRYPRKKEKQGKSAWLQKDGREEGTASDVIQQQVETLSTKHLDMDHGLCGSTSRLASSHLSAAWRLVTRVKRVRAALRRV